jgi:hypothetical protein
LSASPVNMQLMRIRSAQDQVWPTCSPHCCLEFEDDYRTPESPESTSDFSHALLDIGVTVSISVAFLKLLACPCATVRRRRPPGLGISGDDDYKHMQLNAVRKAVGKEDLSG